MTYEKILVPAASGTGAEEFEVRISRQGVREWEKDRDLLRSQGKPDRPPDVDTPEIRFWLPHPGEERDEYFIHDRGNIEALLAENPPTFVVGTWKWAEYGTSFALQLVGHRSGTFGSVAFVDAVPTGERHLGKNPDAAWAKFEIDLAMLCGQYGSPKHWASYFDFEAIAAEIRLAIADLKRGFISTMPEGRA